MTILTDNNLETAMSALNPNAPVKIILNGKTGILVDEQYYDELLETLIVLQENPTIVQQLEERMNGDFMTKEEFMKEIMEYV